MVQKVKCKHFNKDVILTKDDEQNFKNADKCYICNKKCSAKDIFVRDHCHIIMLPDKICRNFPQFERI